MELGGNANFFKKVAIPKRDHLGGGEVTRSQGRDRGEVTGHTKYGQTKSAIIVTTENWGERMGQRRFLLGTNPQRYGIQKVFWRPSAIIGWGRSGEGSQAKSSRHRELLNQIFRRPVPLEQNIHEKVRTVKKLPGGGGK